MLLWIEFWTGIACLIIVAILMCFVSSYASKNETFYRRLNNRLEKEVDYVNKASLVLLSDIMTHLPVCAWCYPTERHGDIYQ